MNFFQHQDKAKQNTTKLVALFALGVLSLIITVTLLIIIVIMLSDAQIAEQIKNENYSVLFNENNILLLVTVAFVVIGIVLVGTWVRSLQLKGGGKSVAESLEAKLIHPNTTDLDQRRVLNVVEEMAIASGIPVPPVYMIEDDSINAFAAGFHQKDAVIGVTRGCVKLLNRDELQGVMAHEFSHILHGDMRLNIRLVSWLYGIILIGLIGGFVFRGAAYGSMARRRDKDSGVPVALIIGIGMMIVGYAGSFFGGLIRSAVSRQREYLADASAVQYTRNPRGIAGALKKIGANAYGSQIRSAKASEFSHMFFGSALNSKLGALGATHPPLPDRIKRIDPNWNGEFPSLDSKTIETEKRKSDSRSHKQNLSHLFATTNVAISKQKAFKSLNESGEIRDEHIDDAKLMLQELDSSLYQLSHEPFFARVIVYAMLLSRDSKIQDIQKHILGTKLLELKQSTEIFSKVQSLDLKLFIPLLELLLPALKELSQSQYQEFKKTLQELIKADNKISLFEWSLYNIVEKNIEGIKYSSKSYTLSSCKKEIELLISTLAYSGQSGDNADRAYQKAYATLNLNTKSKLLKEEDLSFKELDIALNKLAHLKPMQKLTLMKAMIECVSFDDIINQTEYQLLKAIADSIDVVLPPIIQ